MTKEELEKILEEDKEIFATNDLEKIKNIIEKRAGKFENIDEVLRYIDTNLKKSSDSLPEYYETLITKIPSKIIDENLQTLLEKVCDLYNNGVHPVYVNKIIENIIQNIPQEIKTNNYDYLINFLVSNDIQEMSNLERALIIEKNLSTDGVNLDNFFRCLKNIRDSKTESTISRIENKIIEKLPEEIIESNDDLVKILFTSNDSEKIKNIIEKRAGKFENIDEVLSYIDTNLKKSSDSLPEYYETLITKIPSKIIDENLQILLGKVCDLYNNGVHPVYVNNSIENIIQNIPQEVKTNNYDYLINFLVSNEIQEMDNLQRALIIEDDLPTDGVNLDNYENIFRCLKNIRDSKTESNISRIENKIIEKLPEEIIESNDDLVKILFTSNDSEKIKNIIEKRAGKFENIDEVLSYIDTNLKKSSDSLPKYYETLITKLPSKIIDENLQTLLEKVCDLYNNGVHPVYVNKIIENIIQNIPQEIKTNNYDYLINFLVSNDIQEMNNLQRALIIEKDLSTDGVNLDNYENIFRCLKNIRDSKTESTISRIETEIFKELPEEIIESNDDLVKILFTSNDSEKIKNIIEKRAGKFENIDEVLSYIDTNLKKSSNSLPEYYGTLITKLPSKIIDENLQTLLEKVCDLYNNGVSPIYVNDSIENIIQNIPQEVKINNYSNLINFLVSNDIQEMDNLQRALIIGNDLSIDGVNLDNYENIFRCLKNIRDTENESTISRIENKIIMGLPEEVKASKYDDFVIKILDNDLNYKSFNFMKFFNGLPNDFIKDNYEKIINQFLSLEPNDLDLLRYFPEFIPPIFMTDAGEEIDNNSITKALTFINEKVEEIGFLAKNETYKNIIKSLPPKYIAENVEVIGSLFDEKIPSDVSIYILENLDNEIISKYENKLDVDLSLENIEHIQKYFEYLLANNENSLIENDLSAQIFNFVNSISEDNTKIQKIKEIIELEKNKIELPDMGIYSKYIPQKYSEQIELMDSLTFEHFCKDLKKLKVSNGRIPEEYCDYLINQKLNNNSDINQNIDKYLPLLKRAFEDKSSYILEQNGITGYQIIFFEDDGKGTLGYQNADAKKIAYLEDNLRNLNVTNTHIINTMFHEIQHAIQAKNYGTTDFSLLNGLQYNMLKEEIIRKDDLVFYNRNYSRMYCEIEARLAGARGQAEYLYYLGVPENQIIEDNKYDKILLKDCYELSQKEEKENEDYAINKIDRDGNIVSIAEKVSEILKKDPSWLEKYPILALEFNENGERKSTVEILKNALNTDYEKNSSLEEIYRKIFDGNIKVDLDENIECLDYILKRMEDDNSKRTIDYSGLIIENELLYSLANMDATSEKFREAASLLGKISVNNPDVEISNLINSKLQELSESGTIQVEKKVDRELSNSAVRIISRRKIESMEDFNKTIEDIHKLLDKSSNYNLDAKESIENILISQINNKDNQLDVISMLEKSISILPIYEREYVVMDFIKEMPAEMQTEKIEKIVNGICEEYGYNNLSFAIKLSKMLKPEVLEKNPNFVEKLYENILPTGETPFLRLPKNAEEFEIIISEAKSKNAEDFQIRNGMEEIVKREASAGNPNAIEMFYTQVENLDKDYRDRSVSTFFIYASDDLKEQNVETILRHILVEEDYFEKEDVSKVIESGVKYLNEKTFQKNPELMEHIESIKKEAIEKKKEQEKLEFERLPETIKIKIEEEGDFSFVDRENFIEKMKTNIQNFGIEDSTNTLFKILELEKLSENHKEKIIEQFIEQMSPEERKNQYSDIIEKLLAPGEIPFLDEPKNVEEFEEIISEAKSKNADYWQIKKGMEKIVEREASAGNPEAIEMFYAQLENLKKYDRTMSVSTFFICASDDIKEENVETILRHILVEEEYFEKEDVNEVIEKGVKYLKEETFQKNSGLGERIENIKKEALEKEKTKIENPEEIYECKTEDYEEIHESKIEKEDVQELKTSDEQQAQDELMALQEIRANVSMEEIETGKKSIKQFLSKTINKIKTKVDKFFRGGDERDGNR